MSRVRVHAAGRVNVIGDHTDYTGGLALPMAIDQGTTITAVRGGEVVRFESDDESSAAAIPLDVDDAAGVEPQWARYVAGVVAELRPPAGCTGRISSTLPIGAGLSSSASLQIAVALTLGFDGTPLDLAALCQRAEHRASGVPCGLMDQLAIVSGTAGSMMLVDCRALTTTPVELPDGLTIVGVHSGHPRKLATSAYAQRRAECAEAERAIGPLRDAGSSDVERIDDPVVRRRARHVVTENERVLVFADALASGDTVLAGQLLAESHRSLADDFEVTTPALDDVVAALSATPGVHGARMTGAGFGGVAIALCDAAAGVAEAVGGWTFRPAQGVVVEVE